MMNYWQEESNDKVGDGNLPPKQESNFKLSPRDETESSNNPRVSSLASSPWFRLKDPRIVRVSRAFRGKDRHSKVCTIRGLRDRRVRLSVPTAIQLYGLQERLGLSQPSKVVDWLLDAAKNEIDELPPLPMIDPVNLGQTHLMEQSNNNVSSSSTFDHNRVEEQEQEQGQEHEHEQVPSNTGNFVYPLFPYHLDPQLQAVEDDPQSFNTFLPSTLCLSQTQPNNSTYLPLALPYLRTSLVENVMDLSHVNDHHHQIQMGSGSSQNCFLNSLAMPVYSICHHPSERIPFDFDVNARASAPHDHNGNEIDEEQ